MEATPRRRVAVVPDDEDGETNEGSDEGGPRRRRQCVAVESEDDESNAGEAEGREEQEDAVGGVAMGNANDGDVPMAAPNSFECAICCAEKPMESAVKAVDCKHPDSLVCGGCMFTEVCGNAASCPWCRRPASELEQVATGRRYEVTETTLSRLDTQGGEPAEPGDPNACHTCHKFGFLLVCDGGCEQNRCLKCSGLDWPPGESDPFHVRRGWCGHPWAARHRGQRGDGRRRRRRRGTAGGPDQ